MPDADGQSNSRIAQQGFGSLRSRKGETLLPQRMEPQMFAQLAEEFAENETENDGKQRAASRDE